MEEQVTAQQVEETAKTEQAAPAEHKNVLFGTIGYNDDSAYENFIQTMNLNQAIFVLVSSANYAQSKGVLNMLESETLANAIRTIRKNSSPDQNAQAQATPNQTEE